jgi:hypothetical protein
MTAPRLTGTHHHAFDNVPDVATDGAIAGDVLTVVTPGATPVWEAPTGGLSHVRTYISFGCNQAGQSYSP